MFQFLRTSGTVLGYLSLKMPVLVKFERTVRDFFLKNYLSIPAV